MASRYPFERVLVVGGCGFLGHHIVAALLQLSLPPEVSVLDLNTSKNRLSNVNYYTGSITSQENVESVLSQARPRVIFHAAASVHGSFDLHLRVNVEGTRILLSCAQASNFVDALVYTSSASVIHDARRDLVDGDESMPLLVSVLPCRRWWILTCPPRSHTSLLCRGLP